MTWLRSLRFTIPTMAILLMSLPACSLPSIASHPAASSQLLGERCADLLAAALSSPDAAVAGAFACQAPALASNAQSAGITSDADVPGVAKAFGFTASSDLGAAPGVFTFLMTGANQPPQVLVVWTDANGLASAFVRAAHP